MRDQQERPRLPKTLLQSADPSFAKAKNVNGSELERPGRADIFSSKLKRTQTPSHGAQASDNLARGTSKSAQDCQTLSSCRRILASQRPKVSTAASCKGQGELKYLVASSNAPRLHPMGLRLVVTWQEGPARAPKIAKNFPPGGRS